MSIETLKANLRTIPDFPKKGILFYDVTTLFRNAECFQELTERTYELYKDKGITKVVGIESRGFVLGAALALKLGAGLVLARKPGKLPARVVSESYAKEYGVDTIEIHVDAISPDDVVLIYDDILATGGTAAAAYRLVQFFKPKQTYVNFTIELLGEGLHGRTAFPEGVDVKAIMQLD